MARRSFAHTEKPQGTQGPMHQTQALDALSALARRGGADIKGDQLQQQMPKKPLAKQPKLEIPQQKPPSPVAMEAMSRSQQPQQQPQQQPEQMAQQGEFQPPPVEGYYSQLLAQAVQSNPMPEGQPDWRMEALDKFSQIRQKLDMIRQYINSGDTASVRDHVRDLRKNKSANV